jgi:hypothetical protein
MTINRKIIIHSVPKKIVAKELLAEFGFGMPWVKYTLRQAAYW